MAALHLAYGTAIPFQMIQLMDLKLDQQQSLSPTDAVNTIDTGEGHVSDEPRAPWLFTS